MLHFCSSPHNDLRSRGLNGGSFQRYSASELPAQFRLVEGSWESREGTKPPEASLLNVCCSYRLHPRVDS
eukprot:2127938-Amphidinium_carterae.2